MRDLDETTITDAVIERFADAADPRLRAIMISLVRHLHAFVRDVEPTPGEWAAALDFLACAGRACTGRRQEYVLLSDVLGVSTLVDAINHRMPAGATQTTLLGPFYVAGAPELPDGADLARGLPGEPLYVEGMVSSADGRPLAGAVVDVWQADDAGYYDVQLPDLAGPALRGRFRTNARGRFAFWSVVPSHYPVPADGPVGRLLNATRRHPFRPAHIHFMLAAEGHETLVTHVFAADSPYLDSDAVFGVKSALIAEFAHGVPGAAPDGRPGPWRKLVYRFGLKPRVAAVAEEIP